MEFEGIHPTAVIHQHAKISKDVMIAPYAIIGAHVTIGQGSQIGSHAVIEGYTTIGEQCRIFPGAFIGTVPQDLKYKPTESYVTIGDHTTIRECVTINPGTHEDETTAIGSHNLIMAYSHIAHNCQVGNHTILANNATLAGHVTIGDYAVLGGMVGIHQFVKIGQYVMIGGCSLILKDIAPFFLVKGNPAKMRGTNAVGLRRAGFSSQERLSLKRAFKILFTQQHSTSTAVELLQQEFPDNPHISAILAFIADSQRGLSH